ncbi:MAG TPA: sigma-70 family RNA polymerase sigma factor [Burkholderiaceae bacterium]
MSAFAAAEVDHAALERLFSRWYEPLRAAAHARLRSTQLTLLDTTSLVHECYLRCAQAGVPAAQQARFLVYAARVMRSVIVDFARRESARGEVRAELDAGVIDRASAPEGEVIRVSEALDELARVDSRLVRVVEMRYFAGLSDAEIAHALGVTDRTVRRDWRKARLLLAAAIRPPP